MAVRHKSVFSTGGLLLVLAALVLVNLILLHVNLRWDLTEDRIYSLSEGTQRILANLQKDVTLKFFYTKNAPNLPVSVKNYAERVMDFLSEYRYSSGGKIHVQVIDTKIDTDEEEWAKKYGIRGIDLPTGDRFYMGLVAEAADQEQAIPMLDPAGEQQLEYHITRIISRVQSAKRQKIAIISGLPVFGGAPTSFNPSGGGPPWMFVTELKKTYQVEEISLYSKETSIAPDVGLLILIHPKEMSEALQYAVDQYVLGGGNLLVFVDPYAVMDMTPGIDKGSSLGTLFKTWGFQMDKTRALIDLANATRLRAENNKVEDNPLWLSLRSGAFNKEAVVTAKLEGMLLPVAGVFEKLPESKFEYESLLHSSPSSSLIEAFKTRFSVEELRKEFKPSGKTYDLAVKVRGTFPTAFPEGPPKEKNDAGSETKPSSPGPPPQRMQGEKPSTIIVIGDADCLYDGYYVNRQNFLGFEIANIFNDNLNFLMNASEVLSGADDLISIRSRGSYERPFIRVQELQDQAQAKWLDREQELVRKVDALNKKLNALEKTKDASQNLILSPEQEKEVQKFQEERRQINHELKKVRRSLRADIETLGAWIKFINIFLVPMLVCLAGGMYALYRRQRSHSA